MNKSIANYLNDLINQRNNLADNLNAQGVSANRNELLNTLVPKVLDIRNIEGSSSSNVLQITNIGYNFIVDSTIIDLTEY
jgi:hypothetical protein